MADRGPVHRAPPRGTGRPRADPGTRTTVVVTRPTGQGLGLDPPPPGPFSTPPPTDLNPSINNRLASSASVRELTVHPAEGVVPVQYGGPLRVGGFPIYVRRIGQYLFVDFAIGEGPYESLATYRWGDKSNGELNILIEAHLGVTGDTTSTLINAFEPTYSIPEYIAHVVCRFPMPTQTTGIYNPFDFTCIAEGRVLYNPSTAATEFNGYPVSAAYDALTNDRYGGANTSGQLNAADWAAAEDGCEFEIDAGPPSIKRWEFAIRIDQQDTLENWLKVILSYAHGHLRYVDGKHGVYLELPRNPAQDNNGDGIFFTDTDKDVLIENVSAEITYVQKGVDEVPTVYIVDYTEVTGAGILVAYLPASVQVPDPVDPAIPWIEVRVSMPAIMSGERARRWATEAFNLAQLDKDITIPAWQNAWIPLVGDRFRVSSRVLIGESETNANAGAVTGYEDCTVTDLKIGDSPIIRAGLYRDATFGDVIDPPDPPNPPDPPPDPDDDPPCPTDLAAPNGDPSEYGDIEFTPDPSPLISYYRVYDLFPVTPVLLSPTIDHTHPVGADGKIHVNYPALVHVDGTGTHLDVRVDSVSYAGNVGDSCSTTSWDVSPEGAAECCTQEAMAALLSTGAVSSTSYVWTNYKKIDTVTFDTYDSFNTTKRGAIDFLALPGNAAGVIVPVTPGVYHVTAGVRWVANATGFRALALFYLIGSSGGRRPLHTSYITVDAGGSGYTTGQALTVTGGTLMTGGVPFSGTITAAGGSITGLTVTGGLGYTAVPTIGVSGSGSGSTLTAHLPATFAVSDINFDCVGGGWIKGRLIKEDIVQTVTESSTPATNELSVDMSFGQDSGVLLCVQQNSGGNLDLLDSISVGANTGVIERCRVSMFKISDTVTSDINVLCDTG